MAVDIRIEIFAADLFQQLFKDPVAKYASKVVTPKLLNYSEETLKTSGCNKDVMETVYFFRRIVRNIYTLSMNEYFKGQIENYQDFFAEVRNFCRDIFFAYGNVFDKIFATAAVVYDVGLMCIQSGDKSCVDLCPLIWAMCFDSEIKDDFYDKGGWDALFQKASAYASAFKVTNMYLKSVSEASYKTSDTLEMVLVVSDYFRLVLLMVHQFEEYFSLTKDIWKPLILELARSVNKLIRMTATERAPCQKFMETKFNITLYFTVLCNYCNNFLDFKKKSTYLIDVLSKYDLSLQRSDDHQKPTSQDCNKLFWIYSGLYDGTSILDLTDVTFIDSILRELFSSKDYEPDYDIECEREKLHGILCQKGNIAENIASYLYLNIASTSTNSRIVPTVSSSSDVTNRDIASVSATQSVSATGPVIEFSSDDDYDTSTQVSSSSLFSVELFSDEETSAYGGQKSFFEKSDPSRKLYCDFGDVSAIPGRTVGRSHFKCNESASTIPTEISDKSAIAEEGQKNSIHATTSSEVERNSSDFNASPSDTSKQLFDTDDKTLDSAHFSEVNIFPDSSPIKSQLSFVTKTYSRTADVGQIKNPVSEKFSKLLATIRTDLRNLQLSSMELHSTNDDSCKFPDPDLPSSFDSNTSMANVSSWLMSDCKNASVEDNLKSPSQMSIATDVSSESECVIIEVDQNNDKKLFRIPKATNSSKTKTETSPNSYSFAASQSEHNVPQEFSATSLSDELRNFASAGNNLSSRLSISKSYSGDLSSLIKPLQPITPPLPIEDKDQSPRSPKSFEKDQGIPYYQNRKDGKSSPKVDDIKAKRKLLMEASEETISAKERTKSTNVTSESQPKQSSVYGHDVDQPSTSTGVFESRFKPSVYEHDVDQPSTSSGAFGHGHALDMCYGHVNQPSTSTDGFGFIPCEALSSKPQTKKQKKSKKSSKKGKSRVESPTAVDALQYFNNVDIINAENKFMTELLILGIHDM